MLLLNPSSLARMQLGGGFIIDDLSTVFDLDDTDGRPTDTQPTNNTDGTRLDTVATPNALSSKQEAKLRSFLDAALENITRGYRKRFDASSSLHSLTSYVREWLRVLSVLAHIPPYGSGSTNLLVSYLLRCSTEFSEGITGYSLATEFEAMKNKRKRTREHVDKPDGAHMEHKQSDKDRDYDDQDWDEEQERQHLIASRTKQLNLALQTLDFVDRIWVAVLRGNLINVDVALSNARKAFPDSPDTTQDQLAHHSRISHTILSTSSLVPSPAIDGRFVSGVSSSRSAQARESLPIHGGRANKTVGVTDQVRLRNIAICSREKLFSWMRAELDAPPPPTMQEDEQNELSDSTLPGVLEDEQDADTGDDATQEADDDRDFEDVAIGDDQVDNRAGYDVEQDTEEHQHYQHVFDRKLDPDADDDADDVQEAAGQASDQMLGASVLGTVEAVACGETHDKRRHSSDSSVESRIQEPRAEALPSKRRRRASPAVHTDVHIANANAKVTRSETRSINLNLSDTIAQWDVAFTRLFSRTLRTLSDLSDSAKRADKTDLASSPA